MLYELWLARSMSSCFMPILSKPEPFSINKILSKAYTTCRGQSYVVSPLMLLPLLSYVNVFFMHIAHYTARERVLRLDVVNIF